MKYYNLWCTKERRFRRHSVENNGTMQTIRCLNCDYTQRDVILSKRVMVREDIFKEFDSETWEKMNKKQMK